ncbi:MAG: amidohydrolase family protein [Firmicutes bacterium]|nr:amidohydrolase family protein [Bacillota bacterium]
MPYTIIDCHHHMTVAPKYVENLLTECDHLNIEKVCLIAPMVDNGNELLRKEILKYSDRLCGFALINWSNDSPATIERYKEQGFTGLKFINPPANYNDQKWYPIYEKAEELKMPGLFHLGIVSRSSGIGDYQGPATSESARHRTYVDCNMMRPIYLDTIARAFPTWQIIGAHLGNPWYEEAAMACRWNPNLYFDLSGSTLKAKSAEFIGDLLWWTPFTRYKDPEGRYAWEKIVFGSDVSFFEIRDVLNDYEQVMRRLNIPHELQVKVFGDTARKILGLG